MFAPRLGDCGNRIKRLKLDDASFVERGQQAFLLDRFEQVVNRVEFERLYRVLIECGGKNQLRRGNQLGYVARHFEAVHNRHTNIGEHDINPAAVYDLDGFDTVGRFIRNRQRKHFTTIIE